MTDAVAGNHEKPNHDVALRAMRKIKTFQSEIEQLNEAIDNLKKVVAVNVGEGITDLGSNDTGWLRAKVYQGKRFNESYGKARYPELWEKAAETRKVLTAARAKSVLSGEEYAAFQKPSDGLTVEIDVLNGD